MAASITARSTRGARLAAVLLLAVCVSAMAAPVTVTDDTGTPVHLDHPAGRIVSLAPHVTEMLFDIGAGKRIVGAVSYSDYPLAAQAIPRVGSYASLDYERILSMHPDLVIAWSSGNGRAAVQQLRKLGLTVYVSEPRRLDDVARSLRRFGRLTGNEHRGSRAAAGFEQRRHRLARQYAGKSPVSVFYEVWKQPLTTVNGEHLISHVIRLCGGRNVFAALDTLAPAVSVEAVIEADPDVIVASGMGDERPGWLDNWKQWSSITAVKQDNLYFIPPELIQRQTPRVLDGAARLCRQLDSARGKLEPQMNTDKHR